MLLLTLQTGPRETVELTSLRLDPRVPTDLERIEAIMAQGGISVFFFDRDLGAPGHRWVSINNQGVAYFDALPKRRFRRYGRRSEHRCDHPAAGQSLGALAGERAFEAFEAFAHYRDLGPDRSLRRVGRDLGKSRAAIEELSVRWNWVARAFAYDAHLDRKRQITNEHAFVQMNERHARLGQAMQAAGERKVRHVAALLDSDPTALSPSEAVSMINTGQKLEREARGAAIDTTEDPSERVREFERIVLEAIDQANPDTGRHVREAIHRLAASASAG